MDKGEVGRLAALFRDGQANNAERRPTENDTGGDAALAQHRALHSGFVQGLGTETTRPARSGEDVNKPQTFEIVRKDHDADHRVALALQAQFEREQQEARDAAYAKQLQAALEHDEAGNHTVGFSF